MQIVEFLLHFDKYLANLINFFGPFTYIILFLIIFAETGLVVTPFLPGDSLLFVVGTLSGGNFLNLWISYCVLLLAAVLGDTANYWLGHHLGHKVFSKQNSKLFNKAYLEKTHEFYAKYGGKTIILARFIPIIRTFAPFVAGMGSMHYRTFLMFNMIGAFIWVTAITFAGYFFGGLPFIQKNFEYAVIGIIIVSILPAAFEFIKHKISHKAEEKEKKSISYQKIEKTFKEEHLND
jgi:membrane-associated protein